MPTSARAAGESRPLLGLPMTLKESTQVAGLPQSAGIMPFKDYRPETDGPIARSVFAAGSCLLGKTNIPVALGDWQADSPVYGRANNPWDLDRTPGGSTGGGAAALAAGFTPLEIGSDIGGSIRVPAAYCGVYGHRPSETAVPRTGSFPLADRPNPAIVMGVQGPARSQRDRPRAALRRRRRPGLARSHRVAARPSCGAPRSVGRLPGRDHAAAVARAAVVRDAGEGRRARDRCCRRAARRSARRCPRSITSRTSATT